MRSPHPAAPFILVRIQALLTTLLIITALIPSPAYPTPARPAPTPTTQLQGLSWMIGRWTGGPETAWYEETWLPPRGGAMCGTFRLVNPEGTRFLEFMVLSETAAGTIEMRLRHFDPDLTPWEPADAPMIFQLDSLQRDHAVFKRILDESGKTTERLEYRILPNHVLEVQVHADGEDEATRVTRFTFESDELRGSDSVPSPGTMDDPAPHE